MSVKFTLNISAIVIGALWMSPQTAACGQYVAEDRVIRPMEHNDIESVLKKHSDSLMSLPGVVGTAQGICAGKPCIRIYVAKKSDAILKQIPAKIEGYPVEILETGEIRPRSSN